MHFEYFADKVFLQRGVVLSKECQDAFSLSGCAGSSQRQFDQVQPGSPALQMGMEPLNGRGREREGQRMMEQNGGLIL